MSSGLLESAGGEESLGEETMGAEGMAVPSSSTPQLHGGSGGGQVLTTADLENQREIINELRQIRSSLINLCDVMSDISN